MSADSPLSEHIARLRLERERLVEQAADVEEQIHLAEADRRADPAEAIRAVVFVRDAADLRERLLREGDWTEYDVIYAGLRSHAELDEFDRQGRLAEAAFGEREFIERQGRLVEAVFGVREFIEELHPRGGHGRFASKGIVRTKGRSGRALPRASQIQHVPREPRLPSGRKAHEPQFGATPKPPPVPEAQRAGTGIARAQKEGRVPTADEVAADIEHARTLGLNKWPDKGETATKILGDARDTQELHSIPADGDPSRRVYTPKRAEMHEKIIDALLRERGANGAINPDGKAIEAKGKPVVLMMAGGTASGKSTALASPEASGVMPENAVHVDPDEIKALLPEYHELVEAGDKYTASAAHEESSDIAKELTARAMKKGLSVVVDGTGDSQPGKFVSKMKPFKDAGYEVRAFYVNAPTDVAVVRAVRRAQTTGRYVPVPETRNIHRGVSQAFENGGAKGPSVRDAVASGLIDDIRGFDTSGGAPVLMFSKGRDGVQVHDEERFAAFVAKQHETPPDAG